MVYAVVYKVRSFPPLHSKQGSSVSVATSKAEHLVVVDSYALLTTAAKAEVVATGWDPYEVWRTRVLLPRLAEEAALLRRKP